MRHLRSLLLLLSVALAAAHAAEPRPNILVIVADDLGYNDVGFQGARDIPTPHLDRLAASGIRCTDGYVSYPVCSPSRAGLLTGRYQQRFGYEYNPKWDATAVTHGLPLSESTLADSLRSAGYTTGAIGKWHLGAHPQFHPNRRGFDEFFGFLGGGHRYLPGSVVEVEIGAGKKATSSGDAEHNSPLLRNSTEVPEVGELTTRLGEEATASVTRYARDPKPWFLYLAFNAPHTPMQARADQLARFASITDERRRTYAAMVATIDEAVGRILGALDATGQRERTLIFFLSDNGGPMTKRNANASVNSPLRGQKGDVFEGGIRVPFIVSWPARIPAGRTYAKPVIALDILPTALAAAGTTRDARYAALDGVDLLPFLTGKKVTDIDRVPAYWPDNETVRSDMLDYAVEVERFDAHVGELLEALAVSGAATNTLVVVTSDHGMPFPRVKGHTYDDAHRVPLIVRWPAGLANPGRRAKQLVSAMDFAPTFLELAGVDAAKSGLTMTGRSFADLLRDRPAVERPHVLIGRERNDVYARPGSATGLGYPVRGIRAGNFLFIRNFAPDRWPCGNPELGLADTDASPTKALIGKLGPGDKFWEHAFGKRPAEQLFNVVTDPDCVANLAADNTHATTRDRLRATLTAELERQRDPRVLGEGDAFDHYPTVKPAPAGWTGELPKSKP